MSFSPPGCQQPEFSFLSGGFFFLLFRQVPFVVCALFLLQSSHAGSFCVWYPASKWGVFSGHPKFICRLMPSECSVKSIIPWVFLLSSLLQKVEVPKNNARVGNHTEKGSGCSKYSCSSACLHVSHRLQLVHQGHTTWNGLLLPKVLLPESKAF